MAFVFANDWRPIKPGWIRCDQQIEIAPSADLASIRIVPPRIRTKIKSGFMARAPGSSAKVERIE